MKRILTGLMVLFFGFHCLSTVYGKAEDKTLREKAEKLHGEAIVIDAHAHPFYFGSKPAEWTPGTNSQTSRIDFDKMKKGGIDAVFYALPFPTGESDRKNSEKNLTESSLQLQSILKRYPETAVPVFTPRDLEKALKSGKRAVFLSIEAMDILNGDVTKIDKYSRLGYRSITVLNSKADPIADPGGEKGLNDFGRKVIKRMNDMGVMVDITHVNDRLQSDIIEASRTPVLATHSNARALDDLRRNIPDNIIKALAKKGGVIAVTFSPRYLSAEYQAKLNEAQKKLEPIETELEKKFKDDPEKLAEAIEKARAKYYPPTVGIDVLVDHIDYIVKLVGPDHVAIGSDYIGSHGTYPKGLEDASGWPLITYHLLKRGYSEEDIKKILGGNLLRVFKANCL